MRQRIRRAQALGALLGAGLALLLVASGCSSRGAARERLQVYAAASLTEAFGDLEASFERSHPQVDVVLTFAGSQVLRLQIEHGAPADLFASASVEHLDALVRAGLARKPRPFAENELTLIVPPANPAKLRGLADLPRAERLVLGTPEVPIGRYARRLLAKAAKRGGAGFHDFERRVTRHVVSQENNVRLLRAKVELGEADAALVYRTDVISSSRVTALPIPEALNVHARYLLGQIVRANEAVRANGAARASWARRFARFVHGARGQAALARRGFRAVPRGL
jgi:molybdate transport system substrate-binding protein